MKRIIILLSLLTLVVISKAQISHVTNSSTGFTYTVDNRVVNRAYNSYEDYKTQKPVEGIEIFALDNGRVYYKENGEKKKVKPKEFPYQWATSGDGFLLRKFNENFYYVVTEGPITIYTQLGQASIRIYGTEIPYAFNPELSEDKVVFYYSEKLTGDIKKLPKDMLEELLNKYNMVNQYNSDKVSREKKDSVWEYYNKVLNKQIKYFKLINEKIK